VDETRRHPSDRSSRCWTAIHHRPQPDRRSPNRRHPRDAGDRRPAAGQRHAALLKGPPSERAPGWSSGGSSASPRRNPPSLCSLSWVAFLAGEAYRAAGQPAAQHVKPEATRAAAAGRRGGGMGQPPAGRPRPTWPTSGESHGATAPGSRRPGPARGRRRPNRPVETPESFPPAGCQTRRSARLVALRYAS
jgi:hypothetical protein